jgi:AcrR family transcriptional regulator
MRHVARTDASKVKLRTVDKRTAGRRARETRDRILEALGKLLTTMPYRNIRVTDVVKEVGTSPATFYQYFADIESAVLALAQDAAKDAAGLKSLTEGANWTGKAGAAATDKVVDGISARFKRLRTQLLKDLTAPIAAAAGDSKEAKANAAALVGLLAYTAGARGAEAGATAADLRAAVARLVHWGVTGRKLAG